MIESIDIQITLDKLNERLSVFASSIVYSVRERCVIGPYDNCQSILMLLSERQAVEQTGLSADKVQKEINEFLLEFRPLDSAYCMSTVQPDIAGRVVQIVFYARSAERVEPVSSGLMVFALNLMQLACSSEDMPPEIINRWILNASKAVLDSPGDKLAR
ncbi:hypothetical protein Q3O60_05180 [Alkalimonas collagenimarina]|uniref:Uncharacterized protein n=1 Tax=Alkalimonas collagenimarina TaxID=400390 RepID=A0ABT9GWZ6_9GAMM|nr:hypothetical protein [Alkalimonas collagenimarina]MDP4535571.1 hypothetical protein [Alkalimonas collagenimarina]